MIGSTAFRKLSQIQVQVCSVVIVFIVCPSWLRLEDMGPTKLACFNRNVKGLFLDFSFIKS